MTSNSTFSHAAARIARGHRKDSVYWEALDTAPPSTWEGTVGGPAPSQGHTLLLTWNLNKQLRVANAGHSFTAESDSWFLLLDTCWKVGSHLACFQETGAGGAHADQTRARAIVARWARSRGVPAQVWLSGAPGLVDGKDVRAKGGACIWAFNCCS